MSNVTKKDFEDLAEINCKKMLVKALPVTLLT